MSLAKRFAEQVLKTRLWARGKYRFKGPYFKTDQTFDDDAPPERPGMKGRAPKLVLSKQAQKFLDTYGKIPTEGELRQWEHTRTRGW